MGVLYVRGSRELRTEIWICVRAENFFPFQHKFQFPPGKHKHLFRSPNTWHLISLPSMISWPIAFLGKQHPTFKLTKMPSSMSYHFSHKPGYYCPLKNCSFQFFSVTYSPNRVPNLAVELRLFTTVPLWVSSWIWSLCMRLLQLLSV